MADRKLILIKHAAPLVEPGVPPERWRLSEAGRAACTPLARRLVAHAPEVVVASQEPKAAETAERVAAELKVPWRSVPGLHEHDRSDVPHMPSREFISHMELVFRRPSERVLGRESADQAKDRFAAAVRVVLESQPTGNVAVVSHGTVIALFAGNEGGQSPFTLWRQMGLPSYLVLSVPSYEVIERVDRITAT